MKKVRRQRTREHLRPEEVHRLLAVTRKPEFSRNPRRDYCLFLLMYRHGLRVSEACQLRLNDVDLARKEIYVRRLKDSKESTHPLYPPEPKAIAEWLAARREMDTDAPELFISERRQQMSRSTVWLMMQKFARAAGLSRLTNIFVQFVQPGGGGAKASLTVSLLPA